MSESSQPLNRVSTRIIFFVFLSTFLTALVISWISIDAIHTQLHGQLEARFPALLDRRITQLDEYLSATRTRLDEGLAGAAPDNWKRGRESTRSRILAAQLSLHPAFDGIAVVDSDGQVLAHAGILTATLATTLAASATERRLERGGRIAFATREGARIPLVTRLFAATAKRPGAAIAIAVYRPGPLREHLALEPDEGPGRIILTDRTGRALISGEDTVAAAAPPSLPLGQLLTPGGAAVSSYSRSDGTRMLGTARQMKAVAGYLVVEAPSEIVYSPVLSVATRILLCDFAIVLLFSLLAYRVTTTVMQPIEALSEGAARISRGDVHHEIPTPRKRDEFGLLTRIFNEMMHKLRRSQQEIEQDRVRLTEQNEELQRANEVLAQLSITDGLTKLHNHRYFQDHLTREIKRLSRTHEPLAMLLIDLDDFKYLNDRHGHAAGDEVLANIASLMNDSVRESDLLARYGGEEFVILAPNTEISGAVALAEKIRMSVENASQIIDESMRPIRVTISCGVAQFTGDRKLFFQAADRALYRAKAEGKNCVIAADEPA